jgi:hypothetical protein
MVTPTVRVTADFDRVLRCYSLYYFKPEET